jgi:hypothetical protein
MPARLSARVLAAAACLLAAPSHAHAAGAAEGIARLNALRAANGIPAGITENATWSHGCRLHMRYRARNGDGSNPHDEEPGKPDYTPLGDQAANSAILGPPGPWPSDGRTPWEDAPLHLAQTLAPALLVTGYAPGCLWTGPGYLRGTTAPTLYSYPGDGTSIYPGQQAHEWPFTPGDFVGLPQGTVTGPHLFILGHGTGSARLTGASLTGPDGPVEIRTVDNHTRGPRGNPGRMLPPGTAIIIPVTPLAERSRYRASAGMTTDNGQRLNISFTFTTTAGSRSPTRSPAWPLPLVVAVGVAATLHLVARRARRS